MNVTEYIASGILESYVMGAVSDQEQREVECLSAIYPEIRRELDELSAALENYALLHSVEPPPALKTRLMEQLDFNEPSKPIIRPMPVERTASSTFRGTWVIAASVGLLMLLFSFFLVSQLRNNQNRIASLQTTNSSLQSEVKQLRDNQTYAEQRLAVLQRAGMRVIQLRGNNKAPNSDVLVYWNTRSRQVSVDIKSLPALPANQQYQLWSLVNGKPVDAGVFEANTTNPHQPLQVMKRAISRADAFAVTVEKRGGSPTPTLSTLLAMTPVDA